MVAEYLLAVVLIQTIAGAAVVIKALSSNRDITDKLVTLADSLAMSKLIAARQPPATTQPPAMDGVDRATMNGNAGIPWSEDHVDRVAQPERE